jgi:hypothetical protein
MFLEGLSVKQKVDVFPAPDSEVCITLGAGVEILFEFHPVKDLPTIVALHPHSLRDFLFLGLRRDSFF